MKISKIAAISTIAVMCLTQAHATIDLTSYGAQPGSSGDGTIQTWLEGLVNGFNNTHTDLPAPDTGSPSGFTFKASSDSGGNPNPTSAYSTFPTITGQKTVVIPGGIFEYVVLHFGNSLANGGGYHAYYMGDGTGDLSVTSPYGLSWYAVWNPDSNDTPTPSIPEPSTVIAAALLLLPLGVSTLRILRRKQAANK